MMCNPPFYNSREQISELASLKSELPNGVCTGNETEMITEGGQSQFIIKIIDESINLRTKITHYSSLVGRKMDLDRVVDYLKSFSIQHKVVLSKVGRTTRWLVFWTFCDVAYR